MTIRRLRKPMSAKRLFIDYYESKAIFCYWYGDLSAYKRTFTTLNLKGAITTVISIEYQFICNNSCFNGKQFPIFVLKIRSYVGSREKLWPNNADQSTHIMTMAKYPLMIRKRTNELAVGQIRIN